MKALYATLILLLMAGCWDRVELENRGFVITVGIDKGGEEKPFDVTMAVANVAAISDKGGGKEKESVKKSSDETLASAMKSVDSKTSQKIFYGHTKAIVMGNDFLSDGDMLLEALDALERNNEINRKVLIVAADGKGGDILEVESKDEPLVGLYISNFYKNNQKSLNTALRLDLEHLLKELRFSGGAVIPKVELKDKEIRLGGGAVLKDYKLTGWLTEEEMRGCLWFAGEAEGAQISAEYENIKTPFTVRRSRRKISFYEEDGKLVCVLKLDISGSVDEHRFLADALTNSEKIEQLESKYEELIAGELSQTFDAFQKEYGMDGFSMKELLRKHNYPLYLKHEGNWERAYSGMVLDIAVSVKAVNSGAVN